MFTIAKAEAKDIRAIQEVLYQTWLVTYPNIEFGITVEDIEARFRERLTDDYLQKRQAEMAIENEGELCLVAKNDQEIVGVCRVKKDDCKNELVAIYVLPSYQGRGLGRMFWEEINKFFDSKLDIIVNLAVYNSAAQQFYQKLGFVDTGKRFTDPKLKMPISGNYIPEMEMIIKR